MEAVSAALLIFAKIPHHNEKAIVAVVNDGGHSAAIGIIVEVFAGALKGAELLPTGWLGSLECRGHLEHLAVTLYRVVSGVSRIV